MSLLKAFEAFIKISQCLNFKTMVNPKHDKKKNIRSTKNLEKIEWYMPSPSFYHDHSTIQRRDIIFLQLGNLNT
jgi:hypothetical protein